MHSFLPKENKVSEKHNKQESINEKADAKDTPSASQLFQHWRSNENLLPLSHTSSEDTNPPKPKQANRNEQQSLNASQKNQNNSPINVSITPTVVQSVKQKKLVQRKKMDEEIRQNKPKGMSPTQYMRLSDPGESNKIITQAKFNQFKKAHIKQLKQNKQARIQFNSRVKNFEKTLVQRKITPGAELYNSMLNSDFPEFSKQSSDSSSTLISPAVESPVQKSANSAEKNRVPNQASSDSSQNSNRLPDNVKLGIENLSGYSMDKVEVHKNSEKPSQLQAHAFAQGNEIHLAPGQEQHLPHEAWHVVQQIQNRVKPTTKVKGTEVNDDDTLERDADTMGTKASNTGKLLMEKNKSEVRQFVRNPTIETGVNPVQRVIDDGEQQATILAYVKKLLGDHADETTVDKIYRNVIAECNTVEEAKERANQLKVQRGEIPGGIPSTGTDYDTDKLSGDKTKAMAAFEGLPGHTDSSTDGQYFTWHHIVPQSRLNTRATASTKGAVRLGPSASHRYGDPGNDYTDPNFSVARDGTLTPHSEAIEAVNDRERGGHNLIYALSQKVQQLADSIEHEERMGISKPLADPGQWLIFGSFLRQLPKMTAPLIEELDALIGPGYTANKGNIEVHDFVSWDDLREKQSAEDSEGVSPELFAVLDAGIKSYQSGKSEAPNEHGGKIFARGYKETDPIKIDAAIRKSKIDISWFKNNEVKPNIHEILNELTGLKDKAGPVIEKGNKLIGQSKALIKLAEKAVKASGETWSGTDHKLALGTGDVQLDTVNYNRANGLVTNLGAVVSRLIGHTLTQAETPADREIFKNHKAKVPKPNEEPVIPDDKILPKIAVLRQALLEEIAAKKADLAVRERNVKKGDTSKNRKKYRLLFVDRQYKDETKGLRRNIVHLEEIAQKAESGDLSDIRAKALEELMLEWQAEQKEAYKARVIDDFKITQDERIGGINTAAKELTEEAGREITDEDESRTAHTTVSEFLQKNMPVEYNEWIEEIQLDITSKRLQAPVGAIAESNPPEAWEASEVAYLELLAKHSFGKLTKLAEKIETRYAEMDIAIKASQG